MITSKITYLGGLRTSSVHLKSDSEILTDAPVDNNGKGAAFSPTDLVATALGNCMLTIMGIKATDLSLDLEGISAEITKVMQSNPRKISELKVNFNFEGKIFSTKEQTILQKAAENCPVALSLDKSIKQTLSFNW